MLGVSRRTVENRTAEFNLTNANRFSDIDDNSLDAYTERIIGLFPRSGKIKKCFMLLLRCNTALHSKWLGRVQYILARKR